MAVLIDEPRWRHRDRLWSHVVSDTSFEELHAFAERVGIPRRGFHGDHYDAPSEFYDELVAAGAVPTPSREVVRRLRAAGLRLTPAARRVVLGQGSAAVPSPSLVLSGEISRTGRALGADDEPLDQLDSGTGGDEAGLVPAEHIGHRDPPIGSDAGDDETAQ